MLKYVTLLSYCIVFISIATNSIASAASLSFEENKNTTVNAKILMRTEVLISKLHVPWEIVFLNDEMIAITEREGYLSLYKFDENKQSATLIKRIKVPGVIQIGEGGLLGLAAHPLYFSNHQIYLYRTTTKLGNNINQVVSFILRDNELTEERIIVDDIPAGFIHNGGRIAFGPDGFLYVTTGDAGKPHYAQDEKNLAGKILRIKDTGEIPDLNSFRSPVYSMGHRNPQGLAWDESGNLWSTEHGPQGLDKLNQIVMGKNYGWPIVVANETREGYVSPVINSGEETWAPSGLAYWNGKLYFGGLRGEALFEVNVNAIPVILKRNLYQQFGRIRAVVVGKDNKLYVSTSNLDGRARSVDSEDDRIVRVNGE